MEPLDRMIICRTCGKEFAFSDKEREFFNARGFAEPRHCQECRAQRKREKSNGGDPPPPRTMPANPARSSTREWTQVDCATCGKPATVPFKPVSGRPVYCRDCFAAQKTPREPGDQEVMNEALRKRNMPQPTPTAEPAPAFANAPAHDWVEDDPGPLPEVEPAPDEEGEITVAEFIPMGAPFGSTPEEVNPTFDNDGSESLGNTKEP